MYRYSTRRASSGCPVFRRLRLHGSHHTIDFKPFT
jgi:hypothetical protein